VTVRFPLSRRALPRAVVLAVCVTLIPLPVSAGESTAPPKATATETPKPPETRTLRAAIEKVDTRDLKPTMTSRAAPRRSKQDTDVAKESPAFFKTGPGIAVLAVIAVGVGYALYSTQHDRVHSPGKE
jgi:hypothetical protein